MFRRVIQGGQSGMARRRHVHLCPHHIFIETRLSNYGKSARNIVCMYSYMILVGRPNGDERNRMTMNTN